MMSRATSSSKLRLPTPSVVSQGYALDICGASCAKSQLRGLHTREDTHATSSRTVHRLLQDKGRRSGWSHVQLSFNNFGG